MRLILKILLILLVASVHIDAIAQGNVTNAHPGLKTVVIDPGHGGKDPGALGKGGKVNEKHIVLAVAKKLGQKIKE